MGMLNLRWWWFIALKPSPLTQFAFNFTFLYTGGILVAYNHGHVDFSATKWCPDSVPYGFLFFRVWAYRLCDWKNRGQCDFRLVLVYQQKGDALISTAAEEWSDFYFLFFSASKIHFCFVLMILMDYILGKNCPFSYRTDLKVFTYVTKFHFPLSGGTKCQDICRSTILKIEYVALAIDILCGTFPLRF